jgi:hypothetical protein
MPSLLGNQIAILRLLSGIVCEANNAATPAGRVRAGAVRVGRLDPACNAIGCGDNSTLTVVL